jgi:hypothetical protein
MKANPESLQKGTKETKVRKAKICTQLDSRDREAFMSGRARKRSGEDGYGNTQEFANRTG